MKQITIYTDGGGGTHGPYGRDIGASTYIAVCEDREHTRSYAYADMTNNRAELLAIYHGLKGAVKGGHHVTVVTDSENCIRWINGTYKRKDAYVQVYCQWIDAEITRIKALGGIVVFQYVRGHQGHHYNEKCDKLCTRIMNDVHAGLIAPRPEPWQSTLAHTDPQ